MSYPFADRAAEDERLVAKGTLFDPLTPMTGAWVTVP